MEILSPNFTPILLNVALFLSAMSGVVLVVITVVHWRSVRQNKHTTAFRKAAEPLITGYLEGHTTEERVIETMQQDLAEAISLLMTYSLKLEPAMRSRLQPLFCNLLSIDTEVSALKSKNIKRRLQATERLAYFNNGVSEKALLDTLKDDVLAVRFSAAHSLASHGETKTIEPILLSFNNQKEIHWQRLVEVFLDYGPSAAPTVLAILANSNRKYTTDITSVMIRVLGTFLTPEAVQPLINLLDNPDPNIRLNAAHALGEIGDPVANAAVAELSNDPSWRVRNEAVEAMSGLHADKQIPMLSNALTDSSWRVRLSSAQALHSLGQPGITKLEEVMKNTTDRDAREICRQVLEEHEVLDTKKKQS